MSGYRPRPYRISIRLVGTAIPTFRAAPLYPLRNFYPVNTLSSHRSKNFLKFIEKTCQECVSEDIYRVKGIRVWVPAQATRQGRADIGTALLFPAVLPAVFDTRGRQGGGVSPARPVSFPRLRRGLRFETQNQLFSCHPTGGLLLFRIANSLHIASKSGILHSQGGDKLWQELLMYSLV